MEDHKELELREEVGGHLHAGVEVDDDGREISALGVAVDRGDGGLGARQLAGVGSNAHEVASDSWTESWLEMEKENFFIQSRFKPK